MGMLRECSRPGCSILTLGPYCVEHEPVRAGQGAEAPRQREGEPEQVHADVGG